MILSGEGLSTYRIFYYIIWFVIATIDVIDITISIKIDLYNFSFFGNIIIYNIINIELGITIDTYTLYH